MALKDHPLFFVVAACAATAAVTWSVAEKLRVAPVEAQLEKQLQETRSSPTIKRVTLTQELDGKLTLVHQRISYQDPEGDAKFLSYVVVQTDAPNISLRTSSIKATKEQQVSGVATAQSTWTCDPDYGSYFVTLRVIITDAVGNASLPQDYTITCGE